CAQAPRPPDPNGCRLRPAGGLFLTTWADGRRRLLAPQALEGISQEPGSRGPPPPPPPPLPPLSLLLLPPSPSSPPPSLPPPPPPLPLLPSPLSPSSSSSSPPPPPSGSGPEVGKQEPAGPGRTCPPTPGPTPPREGAERRPRGRLPRALCARTPPPPPRRAPAPGRTTPAAPAPTAPPAARPRSPQPLPPPPEPPEPPEMPVDFTGYWKMLANENFEEYLRALDVNVALRKIANLLKPDKEIVQDGDHMIIRTLSTFRNYIMDFQVGKEFEEDLTGIDDRKCMTTVSWDGDKLECVQKGEKEGRGWTQWIEGDELHLEMRVQGVVCKQVFKKVQ
uniref:Retinol binding protein 1 n=1 Tax=Canis lupus familiaris TaxID=9615 RepID=A0A8P0PHK6_CANLF